jgi:O-antigen/teichoic acid export membrane protein
LRIISTVIRRKNSTERTEPEFDQHQGETVKRSIVVLFASQLMTWGLALLLTISQNRFLGPEGVGILGTALSVWTLAAVITSLGTNTLVTLEMARNHERGIALVPGVAVLRSMAFVVAVVVVAVFAAIAPYDSTTRFVIGVAAVGAYFTLQAEVARAAMYGLQRMAIAARVDVITKVAMVVVLVTVLALGGDVRSAAIAAATVAMGSCILFWLQLRALIPIRFTAPSRSARDALRRGSPYLVSDVTHIIYLQVDIIAISLLVSKEEVGWYAAANLLFASLLFIPTIFMTALFPRIARMHEDGEEGIGLLLQRAVRSMLLLGAPVGLGTLVVAEPVMVLMSGEPFREAGNVLEIFGIVLVLEFLTILFGRFAIATGRHRFFNTLLVIVTVSTIPLDLVLVPWTSDRFGNGAMGGAIAYVITELFIVVTCIIVLAPSLLNWSSLTRLLKIIAASAAMVASAWPLRDRFLPLAIVAGAAAYIATILVLRTLDDEERELAGTLFNKIRGRFAQ